MTFTMQENSLASGLYFDVTVTNPNGNFAISSQGFRTSHQFEKGLNLIAYPTIPPENCNDSYKLITYLYQKAGNKIRALKAIDLNTAAWVQTTWGGSQPQGKNFEINHAQGNLLYVDGNGFSEAFSGEWEDCSLQAQIIDLGGSIKPGINLISIHPPLEEQIQSDQLIENVSSKTRRVESLNRIQPKTARWEAILPFFGTLCGSRFPIRNAEGYLLYSRNP
jgi:hypothetical protein